MQTVYELQNKIRSVIQLSLGKPKRTLLLMVSISLLFSSGMSRLQMNPDYRVFFGKGDPQVSAFEKLQAVYTKDDTVLIAIESNGSIMNAKDLKAIEWLTKQAWLIPFAVRSESLTNFQTVSAQGGDIQVKDFVDFSNLDGNKLQLLRESALKDPLIKNKLISSDTKIGAVNITLHFPGKEIGEEMKSVWAVRKTIEEFRKNNPHLKVYTTGMGMLFAGFNEVMERDMGTLVPLMLLSVLLIIALSTRSLVGVLGSLMVTILSVLSAMGFAGWVGIEITPPVIAAPIMILTLSISNSIHILTSLRKSPNLATNKKEAVFSCVTENLLPILITSLTTVIGFTAMNFSEILPFRHMGNVTAVGVIFATAHTIFFLPSLLVLMPIRASNHSSIKSDKFLESLSKNLLHHQAKVRLGLAGIAIVLAFLSFKNELNDELIKYLDQKVEFRQHTDYVSEKLTGGIYTIEYSVKMRNTSNISDPQYLIGLDKFEGWFKTQDSVKSVVSFAEMIRRINRAVHNNDPRYYAIPTNQEESAQYLLLYEMSLPVGQDLNNLISIDKSSTRFIITVGNISGKELIQLADAGREWLIANGFEDSYGTSLPVIIAHTGLRQVYSMIPGAILSLGLVTLCLVILFGSIRMGLLSMIPNVLPLLAGLGIWALYKGQINAGLSLVFGMTLGIIVDDTVFMVTRYMHGRRVLSLSPEEAATYSITHVGRAAITTSISLIVGFVILSQSSFGLFFDMARLTAITIGLALVFDLTLLPSLLVRFDKIKN